MASIASSKTAGSTHPPLTDPTTCPSSETAIEVPGPRGPERSTLTTVAIATFLSPSRHCATLSRTGFIRCLLSFYQILSVPSGGVGDGAGEFLQRLEVVAGEEDVHVGERGGHPRREGLVAGSALQRVDPDDPVGETTQAPHLLGEDVHVSPVPAVGEDHHYGAPGHPALAPAVHELLHGVAEPCSARD